MSKFWKMTVVCLALFQGAGLHGQSFKIANTAPFARHGAVVEIPADAIACTADGSQSAGGCTGMFRVTDMEGNPLLWQLTSDGKLLVEVSLEAGETVTVAVEPVKATDKCRSGESRCAADTICLSQVRHDFQDDLTWENDRGGYRLYGPSYRAGGGNVAGYDIWTKSVSFPVLAQRYVDHCRYGISYHNDHGNGMDCYTVGRTLGAGMNALMNGDDLIYPCAYEECEILDNGPLRTRVKVTCYPLELPDGTETVETRVITLDKGSWLNRTEVTYSGITAPRPMATGIVVHKENNRGYVVDPQKRFVAYADLTDNPDKGNGVIYIGIVNAVTPSEAAYRQFAEAEGAALGHVMNTALYDPATPYVYYWGAGWSKGGVRGMDDWTGYLGRFHDSLMHPIVVNKL